MQSRLILLAVLSIACLSSCYEPGTPEPDPSPFPEPRRTSSVGERARSLSRAVEEPRVEQPPPDTVPDLDWTLRTSRETRGGGGRETWDAPGGWAKTVHRTSAGRMRGEDVTCEGRPIHSLGWHENGILSGEKRWRDGKCVLYVTRSADSRKQRESVYEDGICRASYVWFPSGQMSEKNLYDREGKYLAAPRWYPNGKLAYEAEFVDGKAVHRTFYRDDGTVERSD